MKEIFLDVICAVLFEKPLLSVFIKDVKRKHRRQGESAVKEQRDWNLLKATHKALHNPYWPSYLRLNVFQHERCLRSSNSIQLERSLINNTLQDQTASLFNKLPSSVRCCQDYSKFCKDTRNIIFKRALELLE